MLGTLHSPPTSPQQKKPKIVDASDALVVAVVALDAALVADVAASDAFVDTLNVHVFFLIDECLELLHFQCIMGLR